MVLHGEKHDVIFSDTWHQILTWKTPTNYCIRQVMVQHLWQAFFQDLALGGEQIQSVQRRGELKRLV